MESYTHIERPLFQHEPLIHPQKQIRLFRFVPGKTPADTACELSTFSRGDAPPYEAISYVCGGPEKEYEADVNGARHSVTANCLYALSQAYNYCSNHENTHFWIDCICIDLNNLEEKLSQVKLMWKIFADAEDVLACIGHHAHDSDFLLDTATKIGARVPLYVLVESGERCKQRTRAHRALVEIWKLPKTPYPLVSFVRKFFDALHAIFRRVYWNRLWILQEIRLAKAVTVVCGTEAIPFTLLFALHSCMSPGIDQLSVARLWVSPNINRGPGDLALVPRDRDELSLTDFSPLECADFHDRFYAVLHIVDWQRWFSPNAVRPDYTLSKVGLVLNFARYVIENLPQPYERESLRIRLNYITELRRGLPLPDNDPELCNIVNGRLAADTKVWNASGTNACDWEHVSRNGPSWRELSRYRGPCWPAAEEVAWNGIHRFLRFSVDTLLWLMFLVDSSTETMLDLGWLKFHDNRWQFEALPKSIGYRLQGSDQRLFVDVVLAAIALDGC